MKTVFGLLILCLVHNAYGFSTDRFKRIVGGSTSEYPYPYQVSLRYLNSTLHFCGGAIISKNYIITAAHCLKFQPSDVFVTVGSNDLLTPSAIYQATSFIIHPSYDEYTNDIGLIYVMQDIEFNENVRPIALASADYTYNDYPLLVTGWGQLETEGPYPNYLQEIRVKVYSQIMCNYYYENIIANTQICTLTVQGEGMCVGDSGSPLVDNDVLIGIVSFGTLPCGSGFPDVYTRFYYRPWIYFYARI